MMDICNIEGTSSHSTNEKPKGKAATPRKTTIGVPLKKSLLILEYHPGKPLFKCINEASNYLSKFGIRQINGCFLQIEEALYLSERGSAKIICNGFTQSIAQIYSLLLAQQISLMKYSVFSLMVNAGYILKKPHSTKQEVNPSLSTLSNTFHFPVEILDQFPSISPNTETIVSTGIQHELPLDYKLIGDPELSIGWLNTRIAYSLKDQIQHLLKNLRRECLVQESCRPRYWPVQFTEIQSADNWQMYEYRRLSLLKKKRINTTVSVSNCSQLPFYDYDIQIQQKSDPIYHLLVIDERFSKGQHNLTGFIQTLFESSQLPLLVATGDASCFKILRYTRSLEGPIYFDDFKA